MMKKFVLTQEDTLLDALERINENKSAFLVIVNDSNEVMGITTEGDIRRLLIAGKNIHDKICYNDTFVSIDIEDNFNSLFECFKSEKINYIPVLNGKRELVNLISKKQFYVMLLKDIDYNLKHLIQVDENELDFEIFSRPWGFYKSTLLADHVQSKIITVFPQGELSLQKHKRREEHWIIIKGEGKIILEESVLEVQAGRYIYIPKGSKHKVINSSLTQNLIFAEVQLGDYFGEDDIIRYEDKYGRV